MESAFVDDIVGIFDPFLRFSPVPASPSQPVLVFARLYGFDAQCPRTRGMCEGRLCLYVAKPSRKFSVRGPVSAGKFRRLVFGSA